MSNSTRSTSFPFDDELDFPPEPPEPLKFSPVEPKVKSLDDVIGLDELKDELRLQVQVWSEPAGLIRLGGKPRVGFVFSGPPGSGKTTSAHALAAETGKDLYTYSGTDFQGVQGRDRLVQVIDTLRGRDAIVFIDEADDLLHKRDFRLENSGPLVKTVLVNVDQTTQKFSAFFIFATNMHPSGIDEALLHAGRLGRPLIFRNLRLEERVLLLEHARIRYPVDEAVMLLPLAAQMSDVPTANLAHLFDEGAFVAFRAKHDRIMQDDLQEAAQRLRAGLERKKGWTEEELHRVSAHEAGHTILRLLTTKKWSSIGFVQVSQRLEGNDGSTHSYDESDYLPMTRESAINQIAISLAGGQAEQLLLGSISQGQEADIAQANSVADKIAAEWGLGAESGYQRVHDHDRYWTPTEQENLWNLSAVRILEEGEVIARTLLRHELVALTLLTDRLREHRVADSDKIKEWLSEVLPGVS